MNFEQAWEQTTGNGWLTKDEAECLWNWAKAAPPGDILEVGCYKGKSTCLLACLERQMHCVDPFCGFDSDDPLGQDIYRQWCEAVDSRGFKHIQLYQQVIERWQPVPVAFAYLDGDHTYAGTVAQIVAAKAAGATHICVHDYAEDGGGRAVANACDAMGLTLAMLVGTMAAFTNGVNHGLQARSQ
jgi:hypothetical protein